MCAAIPTVASSFAHPACAPFTAPESAGAKRSVLARRTLCCQGALKASATSGGCESHARRQPQLDLHELHEANFLPVAVSLCLSLYYTDLLFFLQCFCLLCIFIECDVSQWDLVTAMLFIFILPLTVHIFGIFLIFFPPILPEWFSKRFYNKSHFFIRLSFLSVSTDL